MRRAEKNGPRMRVYAVEGEGENTAVTTVHLLLPGA